MLVKNIPLEKLLGEYPPLLYVPLRGGFKYQYVMVSEKVLIPGECSCDLPRWHLDGGRNGRPEFHHLYVDSKDPEAATEFNPPEPFKIPLKKWFTYTDRDLHRGVYVSKPVRRLLLRVTETNSKYAKWSRGCQTPESALY